MTNNKIKHYLILVSIITLGAAIRFWQLDLKPLWIDEIVTALFSLGKNYQYVTVELVFPVSQLQQLFTLKPEVSCSEIAQTLASQSTHPPLFFCLMHQWLNWTGEINRSLVWQLRAFPASMGVVAIAAIYYLNRLAFSPAAGLMGAAIMAVSPFGVYLSQEARHYTLPVLLITLALIGLIEIQKDLQRGKQHLTVWLSWAIINSISFYVHYFCLVAFVAQIMTIAMLIYRSKTKKIFIPVASCILSLALFIPWSSILIEHFTSPKTNWLPPPQNIVPLFQTIISWILIAIALPIENQPVWIQVSLGLLTIGFAGWLGWQFWRGGRQLWGQKNTHQSTFTLSCFIIAVLLQFCFIIYILGKDITVAPRYNFIYYPAVCALLGASLVSRETRTREKINKTQLIILLVGLASSVFVVFNLAFYKPYYPHQVARQFNQSPEEVMVAVGYEDRLEIALGLSYALELGKISNQNSDRLVAFFDRSDGYNAVWSKISATTASPLNLWVIAPGLRQWDYPDFLKVSSETSCKIDPDEFYRIGFPYQLYRCGKTNL